MSTSCRRPSAVVAHPLWGRGGAESAAMWIVATLLRDFDVTVYTRGGFDLTELNRLAELTIKPTQLCVRIAEGANAWPFGALAHGAFLRSLHNVGEPYNLRVTASGVAHWGRPAIHFLSSAVWNDALANRFDAPNAPSGRGYAQAAASWLGAKLSCARRRSLEGDWFVANSKWTAFHSKPHCPGPIMVIPPAVPGRLRRAGWERRENAVLVFGRVSPEKRIETCIEIVARVREAGLPLRLCIAGPDGDAEYGARIRTLCGERSDWIERIMLVTGEEKERLLGRFRYGLSACEIEAFGIATAEMAAEGMVVLVPSQGAQREILHDPVQIYGSVDDAAERFVQILRDDAEQRRLRMQALATRERFEPERFVDDVRTTVRKFAGLLPANPNRTETTSQ